MSRKLLAGAGILVCTFVLAACDQDSAAPSTVTTTGAATTTPAKGAPAKGADGKDLPIRLLLLADGTGLRIEIKPPTSGFTNNGTTKPSATGDAEETDKSDPPDSEEASTPREEPSAEPEAKQPEMALIPGQPSEYVTVKSGSALMLDGKPLVEIPSSPGERATVVIGNNADGKLEATGFVERDGKFIGVFGVSRLAESRPPEDSKAFVFASGIGLGKTAESVNLGVPGKGCVVDKPVTGKEYAAQNIEPGDVELGWFSDKDCKKAVGEAKKVTLQAGRQAYAFAWSTGGDPKVVFVPIEKSGGSTASDESSSPKKETETSDETTSSTEPSEEN